MYEVIQSHAIQPKQYSTPSQAWKYGSCSIPFLCSCISLQPSYSYRIWLIYSFNIYLFFWSWSHPSHIMSNDIHPAGIPQDLHDIHIILGKMSPPSLHLQRRNTGVKARFSTASRPLYKHMLFKPLIIQNQSKTLNTPAPA